MLHLSECAEDSLKSYAVILSDVMSMAAFSSPSGSGLPPVQSLELILGLRISAQAGGVAATFFFCGFNSSDAEHISQRCMQRIQDTDTAYRTDCH